MARKIFDICLRLGGGLVYSSVAPNLMGVLRPSSYVIGRPVTDCSSYYGRDMELVSAINKITGDTGNREFRQALDHIHRYRPIPESGRFPSIYYHSYLPAMYRDVNLIPNYTGSFMGFYEGGSVRCYGRYKNGRKHGYWTTFGSNGKVEEGMYRNGVKVDTWIYWDKQGSPEIINHRIHPVPTHAVYPQI